MREVYDLLTSISNSDASVIITGESGTGKELAARTIHELSSRTKVRLSRSMRQQYRKSSGQVKYSDMKKAPSPVLRSPGGLF